MVVPGITLVSGELMMRAGVAQLDQAVGYVGVGAVNEQLHRVATADFIRHGAAVQLFLDTAQVVRRAFLGYARRIIVAITYIRVLCTPRYKSCSQR